MSTGLSLYAQSNLLASLFTLLLISAFGAFYLSGMPDCFLNRPDFGFSVILFFSACFDAFKFSFLEVYNVNPF